MTWNELATEINLMNKSEREQEALVRFPVEGDSPINTPFRLTQATRELKDSSLFERDDIVPGQFYINMAGEEEE